MLNWHLKMQNLESSRDEMQNIQLWCVASIPARILTNNPIIFAQFSSNLNSETILLLSTIFTGHFRLHLEALWHNLVAILSRQHEMTVVVIRQEAKFSFMPEILASANIAVGASSDKNCCLGKVGWVIQRPPVIAFAFCFSNLLSSEHLSEFWEKRQISCCFRGRIR